MKSEETFGLGFSLCFRRKWVREALKTRHFRDSRICRYLPSNSAKFGFANLTRNQVIPNGTEGLNPSLSANKQDIAKAMSCFCFKLKRDSNPYNLLQDEVLSKEVYNRIVCGANSRANEVSRVPHSPPKFHRILIKLRWNFLVCQSALWYYDFDKSDF